MKRIHKVSQWAGIFIFGLSSLSYAAMPIPSSWYVEGNLGYSSAQSKNYGENSSADRNGFGWNANIGYKFMPWFATEIGYTQYQKTKINNATTDVQAGKDTHYSYDIAAKGILPISNSGAALFAKLGLARIRSHTVITNDSEASTMNINAGTFNDTGVYMGLGGEYAFTPNILVNAQWARSKGSSNTGNLDLYSFGASYLFG